MGTENVRRTQKQIPVLIGHDGQHVMARADIFRTPDKVLVQITAPSDRAEGQLLADFLEQAEPIALSFDAIPVQNKREKGVPT